jgi:hypothetical protein
VITDPGSLPADRLALAAAGARVSIAGEDRDDPRPSPPIRSAVVQPVD